MKPAYLWNDFDMAQYLYEYWYKARDNYIHKPHVYRAMTNRMMQMTYRGLAIRKSGYERATKNLP